MYGKRFQNQNVPGNVSYPVIIEKNENQSLHVEFDDCCRRLLRNSNVDFFYVVDAQRLTVGISMLHIFKYNIPKRYYNVMYHVI